MAREIALLSSATEQKSKRKPRKQTSVEEKLQNLYNKVEKSILTGQCSLSQYIDKALRADGQEGSLVETISGFTIFSKQYIRRLLPDEYRQAYTVPDKSKLGFDFEQPSKRKPRQQTTDKEKLDNLYKKVENSAFTGQGNTSQKIEGAKELGLNMEIYESELTFMIALKTVFAERSPQKIGSYLHTSCAYRNREFSR